MLNSASSVFTTPSKLVVRQDRVYASDVVDLVKDPFGSGSLTTVTASNSKSVKRAASFALILVALLVVGCSKNDRFVELGDREAENGQLKAAIVSYDRAIENQPNSAELCWKRGLVYERMRDLKKAIADFEKATELEPTNNDYRLALGRTFSAHGDAATAIEHLSMCVESDRTNYEALRERGNAYYANLEFEKARADLDAVIESGLDEADDYVQRGKVFIALDDYSSAKNDLNVALSKESAKETADGSVLALAYWHRAIASEKTGESALAEQDRAEAIRLNPAYKLATSQLGKSLLEKMSDDSSEGSPLGSIRTQ